MTTKKRKSDSHLSSGIINAPSKGIVLIITGMFFFSLHDTIIKYISGDYPAHEIVFFRSVVALLPILLIVYQKGGLPVLITHKLFLQIIRGLCWFVSFTFFYLALAYLTMVETYTLFFISPIFITLFSVIILGERVIFQKWVAISAGFFGVVIIIRPGEIFFNPAAILAILSAISYAVSVILTRRLSKTDSGISMAFYTTLIYLLGSAMIGIVLGNGHFAINKSVMLQFLLRAWVIPNLLDLGLMAFCGLMAGLGFYAITQAYHLTQATAIAHYEYTAVLFSILWGYIVWRSIPDIHTVVGIILVVGSGLYIIRRDSSEKRKIVVKHIKPPII